MLSPPLYAICKISEKISSRQSLLLLLLSVLFFRKFRQKSVPAIQIRLFLSGEIQIRIEICEFSLNFQPSIIINDNTSKSFQPEFLSNLSKLLLAFRERWRISIGNFNVEIFFSFFFFYFYVFNCFCLLSVYGEDDIGRIVFVNVNLPRLIRFREYRRGFQTPHEL